MSDDVVLVRADGVRKKFCRSLKRSLWYGMQDMVGEVFGNSNHDQLRAGEFWAVNDVSFELRRGECLGLIGRNGAGKTTLLKMLNGLIKPDHGRIEMRGRVGALIALGAGFNPILTGRENIFVNGSVLGLSKREIDQKLEEIIDFADIQDFIDSPVRSYSSGMQVRLGFAVATAMEPDVLLLDEVLAVGDANFRSKCFQRIGTILERCAVIFVSHDAYSVRRICNEVLWLRKGQPVFQGATEKGMQLYSEDPSDVAESESLLIVGDYIHNLTYHADIKEWPVRGNETAVDINIKITFDSDKEMQLGLGMANIVAAEAVVGQSILDECVKPIQVGKNIWDFSIRNVNLAKGNYSLVIGIYEIGNKRVAMNIRNSIKFSVKGNNRYGPLYAPIAYPGFASTSTSIDSKR